MKKAFLYIVSIILISCNEENPSPPQFNVPSDFEPYVSTFFQLAESRGFQFETENLIVEFRDNLVDSNNPICGKANGALTGDHQNLILIDPECLAWRYSEESREILILHELGHVYLERVHDDEIFTSGEYKSIMFGGQWDILKYYTNDQSKRSYYIDELFDPSISTPEWAN